LTKIYDFSSFFFGFVVIFAFIKKEATKIVDFSQLEELSFIN